MPGRELGFIKGTDLKPSRVCLGTAEFGTSIARDDSFAIMDAFLDEGGNFLDTAHIYADWQSEIKGMSERTIGDWLASRGCRDRVIVSTKGGHHVLGSSATRLAPEEIRADLEESLRRLRLDFVDLYWLHRDDPSLPVGGMLDTLEGARREGLVRWYAASNWTTARLREAAEYSQSHGMPGMVASQIQWSLAAMIPGSNGDLTMAAMDNESYPYYLKTGMSVVAYSAQASGFFSGKYAADQPESGRSSVRKIYDTAENWGRLQRATELAAELGCTPNRIALAYLIAQPFPTYPIAGCRTIDQVRDSCQSMDINLTPEQVRFLESGFKDA